MSELVNPSQIVAAEVRSARIRSLEGSIYLVELDCAGGRRTLGDGRGRAVFRSLPAARAALAVCGAIPLCLVHDSVYDEMIGLGAGAPNRLEVALGQAGA
jgi:Family of unknown function (DUF6482)